MTNKTERGRYLFNKRDIFLLGGLLLLAAVIYCARFFRGGAGSGATARETFARITVGGVTAREADLSRDEVFALDENPRVRFEVRGGAIAFIESDCPDKVCVHSGFLNMPGQTAACLPNGVLLFIEGDAEEMDAVGG